jgi:transcription antitermination protein NusB
MKTTRTLARQTAFQFIYRLGDKSAQDSISFGSALNSEILTHFEHFQVLEEARDFAMRLILITLQSLPKLDEILTAHMQNWKLERVGTVERALLRMGTAELLFFKDIPANVTLDEIIELGKSFGNEDSASFLNGILDPISKIPESLAGKVASD